MLPILRHSFCACCLMLLAGAFELAPAQTISTAAGGFNPIAAASENFCEPITAVKNHGTDVYVISCNQIFKIDAQGNKTLVAGNGMTGFNGDNIPATSASLGRPRSISLDPAANLYVYDSLNARVRKVDATTGTITTIAGTGVPGFNGDGLATSVKIGDFGTVFVDASGNCFIADTRNSRIREISGGMMQTIAGNGISGFNGDGLATSSRLAHPQGVWEDGSGNVFFADSANGRIREIVKATGNLQTVAGGPGLGFSGDGGPATSAMLFNPSDLIGDGSGNFFLSDRSNNRVRKFTLGGNIETVAGNGSFEPSNCNSSFDFCSGDGQPATGPNAIIGAPDGVSLDTARNLFIVTLDTGIREVVAATGLLQTFAGNGALGFGGNNGPATSAQLLSPIDAVEDALGNIYIADTFTESIREVVAATGEIKTVAGGGMFTNCSPRTEACIGNGGPALGAPMNPQALAVDGSGNIFVADGVDEIREFTVGGNIQSVAGSFVLGFGDSGDGGPATSAALGCPTGVALDAAGNIFIADDCNANIREVVKATRNIQTVAGDPTGMNFGFSGDGGPATKATFTAPIGVYVDNANNIFVSDVLENRIREVAAATGIINTVAGNGIAGFSGDNGPATSAEINNPALLHGDSHGNVFIADFNNHSIREFTIGGNIQTVAGNGTGGFAGDGGPATNANLDGPDDVFVDSAGRLLIADFWNARVRMVEPAGAGSQATSTSVSSSPKPSGSGKAVTFSATVTASGTPTGIVTFFDSGNAIGSVALYGNGQATFATPNLAAGSHSITAQYSGDSVFADSTSTPLIQTVRRIASADFDGDGNVDIAVWRPSTGQWFIIPSTNPGSPITQSWGLNGDVPVPGDYDGDGKTDFAVWRPSSGQWFIIPSSNPGTPIVQQWGTSGDIPVPADYDGDGKTDFAVWRPSTGQWFIMLSSNPGSPITQSWGLNGDVPVPGDYDGDGKTDFAVWRPSTGQWFINPSSNPGSPITQSWGLNGDIPVPGDYDGDGKTDFAVFRPSTGQWFIIPSSNPGSPITQSWGLNGDVPVPRDYDGDGKTDLAVWRPSTGQWFVIPSATPNNPTVTSWGLPGDVPVQRPIGQ